MSFEQQVSYGTLVMFLNGTFPHCGAVYECVPRRELVTTMRVYMAGYEQHSPARAASQGGFDTSGQYLLALALRGCFAELLEFVPWFLPKLAEQNRRSMRDTAHLGGMPSNSIMAVSAIQAVAGACAYA